MNLEARARAVVDERLFAAYWASVDHFGTTDLVLYFDTEREEDPVDAFVRARLLADPSIPGPPTTSGTWRSSSCCAGIGDVVLAEGHCWIHRG